MTAPVLIRSAAGAPMDSLPAVARAQALEADVLMVDLELPPARRLMARANLETFLAGSSSQPVFVRVAPTGRPEDLSGDLASSVQSGLTGVIVPDCESPSNVVAVAKSLDVLEDQTGLPNGSISIIPLPESAIGVRNYYEVLMATPRIGASWFAGSEGGDLARDVGYHWSTGGEEFLYLRSKVALDSHAAGIDDVIDGVWRRLDDDEGFRRDTRLSRDLGYTARLTLSGSQTAIANEVYGSRGEGA